MEQFNDNNFCFACGSDNPQGLHLQFHYDDQTREVHSNVDFAKHFQGWHDVLHGGLISTALDEIMIKAAFHQGYKCVTAELNVRFKKPAMINKSFTIKGKVKDVKKRVVFAESSLTDSDNTIVATASGKFITIT
ncbi:MAG: PaaI family thioesterase [bacterium]|nr:PaaI family thioesterase [bacterium]